MTELLFNTQTGFGKCEVDRGTYKAYITVLKTRRESLYNLSITTKEGFSFWVKENCKRLSTIQRYLDAHNYGVTIKEV